ncbi:MAG: hypothetical protein LBS99_07605 [Clostridiales bacterium]|jgi:hypothetical protein|nr:hypothetical protein [Clostridiales bacterium]
MVSSVKNPIKTFLSEVSRAAEEDYLRVLTSCFGLNLFFARGNEAFTDGINIIVDPEWGGIYKEKEVLKKSCVHGGLPKYLLADEYAAIKFIARGLDLHEAYHVLYTRFDLIRELAKDKRADTLYRKKLLLEINNLIEDAFIENAGTTEFDNTGDYLRVLNAALFFWGQTDKANKKENLSRKKQAEEQIYSEQDKETQRKLDFINRFLYIAYVELKCGARVEKIGWKAIANLYGKAKLLFSAAAVECDPVKRIDYSRKIFDLLKKRLPDISDEQYEKFMGYGTPSIPKIPFVNAKTHNGIKKSPSLEPSKKIPQKAIPLYNSENPGKGENESSHPDKLIVYLTPHCSAEESGEVQKLIKEFIEQGKEIEYVVIDDGYEIKHDGHGLHERIILTERKYPSSHDGEAEYKTIVRQNALLIKKFKRRFYRELARTDFIRTEKLTVGQSIMSNRLWDMKGRFWIKNAQEDILPELAVMLFIDGSGSMLGAKRANAIFAATVLCEVLEKNGVAFAVVEHRAGYRRNNVDVNVLRPFKAKPQDKYNIVKYRASGGTRDGMTLLWARDYFKKNAYIERKLLISITDGVPCDTNYAPPVSLRDTRNSVAVLKKAGIETVALALVGDRYELDAIRTIYDNIVLCGNADELPAKLMDVVGRVLE